MYADSITKSKIQLISEAIELKNKFKDNINNLMNNYVVEDAVFTMYNGFKEATIGYFAIDETYDSLDDAIHDLNANTLSGLRVINNNQYQTGHIYNTLSECPAEQQVLDLKSLQNVR